MTNAVITVVKSLDALIDGRQHSRNIVLLLAQG